MKNSEETIFPIQSMPDSALTKKEYTMIHAPSKIPKWFEPKMRPKPSYISDYNYYASDAEKQAIINWDNRVNYDPGFTLRDYIEMNVPKISESLQKVFDNNDDYSKWHQEREIERYFQWREYFATKILEE